VSEASLRLPAALFGTVPGVLDACAKAGARWARAITRDEALPPLALVEVEDGTVLPTDPVAAAGAPTLFPSRLERWRLYDADAIVAEARSRLDPGRRQSLERALEHLTSLEPWRAIAAVVSNEVPNSGRRVGARIRAAVGAWDALSRVRYAVRAEPPLDLGGYLSAHYGWAFETWIPGVAGDVRSRLLQAADAMTAATDAEVREVLVRRVIHYGETRPEYGRVPATRDRAHVERLLARLHPRELENVTSGYPGALLRLHATLSRDER
jgi:hypothetical protein